MQHKRRLVVFVIFVLCMFFLMTFANGSKNAKIATRVVEFIDGFDNSVISSQTIEVGTDAEVPKDPTHKNYVFAGWYLYDDRDVKVTNFNNIMEDLKVIALYKGDINNNGIADENDEYYTVKFVDSLNNNVISSQTVLVGMDATAPAVPSHKGYTFTGWNRGYTDVESDITVKALYRKNAVVKYTVTFIDGDTNQKISVQEVEKGATATLPEPPKHENRVFVRWDGKYTNITKDVTITAIYADDKNNDGIVDEEQAHYTITYVDYDGEVLGEFKEVLVNIETPTVAEPTRDNYKFNGWDPTVATTVTGNATYTATYKPINDINNNGIADEEEAHYTIIYLDYDGKALGTFTNVLVNTATPTVAEPTREYYTFDKWTPSVATTVTETATYTATYKPINDKNNNGIADEEEEHYTIIYLDYDGKALGTFTNVLVNTATPTVSEPTREYYRFTGWNPTVATTVTETVTYTATYEPINDKNNNGKADEEEAHYTIKYVDYDGKTLGEFKDVLVNTATPTVSEPTREYYTFDKWTPSVADKVTGNATYIATYKPINDKNNNGKADEEEAHYTIKYVDYDGKTLGEFKDVLVNTATPTITNPTREYYTFDKWTPSVADKVTGNATYIATYKPINDKNNNGKADEEEAHYTIKYVDYDGKTLGEFKDVLVNTATPTVSEPTREYYRFTGWNPTVATKVTGNATYTATYKPINDKNNDGIADEEQTLWEVKFYGFDGTTQLGDVQYVIDGEDATAPQAPTVKGYTFTKWDKEFTNVKSNLDVKAIYVDTEAPVIDAKVVLYNEKDGSYQNANITATVTDNDRVAEVRYLLGEHQLADYDKATVMSKSADGTYQINGLTKNSVYTIFAKDATGNISVKYVEVEGITVLEGDFEDLYAKGTFGKLTADKLVVGTYRRTLTITTKSDVKIVDARVYYGEVFFGGSYKTVADFEKNPNLGTAIKHDGTKLSYQIEGSFLKRVTIYVKYAEEVEVAPGVTETKYVSKVYTTRLTYLFSD